MTILLGSHYQCIPAKGNTELGLKLEYRLPLKGQYKAAESGAIVTHNFLVVILHRYSGVRFYGH